MSAGLIAACTSEPQLSATSTSPGTSTSSTAAQFTTAAHSTPPSTATAAPAPAPSATTSVAPRAPGRLIGDGSTSDTGPQPNQPVPSRLKPGERPPQFVVVSWDGAGEGASKLFTRWRAFAAAKNVPMTFFVTGLYFLPASARTAYTPPGRAAGASDIPLFPERAVHATIEQIGKAWLEGHEIGTHFNGHFCGPKGGASWTPAQWDQEIAQAKKFVTTWRTTTGFTDLPPLPFDYEKELVGSRTPCLEGQAGLVASTAVKTWRYDSSATGTQVWPRKLAGSHLWNIPLQSIPLAGRSVLSMDYNFYAVQSKAKNGDPAMYAVWEAEVRDGYLAGFRRAYNGNRAPLIIGNHFENWNGGIYMSGLEKALTEMVGQPDVRFVTFKQLCDWLDAQDPQVLAALQKLPLGTAPAGGWAHL